MKSRIKKMKSKKAKMFLEANTNKKRKKFYFIYQESLVFIIINVIANN